MTTQQDREPEADTAPREGFIRRFWRLARGYFTGDERWRARGLAAGVLVLTILQIGIQVRFNIWNRDFFNALETRDRSAFFGQMWFFLVLAAASMVTAVGQLYVRQMLQLDWRRWLVFQLQHRWLENGLHYQLNFLPDAADNPDQRMSENTRWATAMAVDMAVGLITSVLMLVSFVGILWTLSGPLHVAFGANEFDIPGYMVWAALLYAGIGSGFTWLIGRPMVEYNIRRNQAESDHRFALVRLRESSEGVALIRGEADEERGLQRAFNHVVTVMKDLMRSERHLMWLTSAYGMLLTVFPALVASPRFFAGAITLGVLMQISSAFYQVTSSLNWFVDNFPRLADWRSHVERVVELEETLESAQHIESDSVISVVEGPLPDGRDVLAFRDLQIAHADGNVVIDEATAEIQQGEKVLIVGESGSGKSTLFRAIAGLWPWGSGEIRIPPRAQMMFMPQRPYLPLGTLHAAITYPAPARKFSETAVIAALERCGLPHLASRLQEEERWDRILSLGEQQRLAFTRLLLHKPRWVFMDEATAALDEENQDVMMRLFPEELPESALLSIGHRPGLDAYHDRTLTLVRSAEGARLTTRRRRPPPRRPPSGPLVAVGQGTLRRLLRGRSARA
ncbi:ABC transporter ATP-binding protein/permease [Siccirubricoccus sp. G192]|uniref:ABC transporter ATP-binding protein/permease n=1 Tax=Siccirubricoccus sp. G192 TaxID=2849651 RepID=UPI001C2BECDE|nr:ABC transporter ATP-binding protein/permease [Siccirubricoccus sp. G192]MBV1799530.1 ABC transporter ATP-binding protein/permease [Siccirubricoccus sp. G192]